MRAPTDHRVWTSPRCPFTLRHEAGLLEQIVQDVTDSFMAFRKGGLETGGLLFGRVNGDEITLVAHRPIACEHALGPGFVLSESDLARLHQLLRQWPHDAGLSGLELVGWYRSRTRGPLAPAPEDLSFQQQFLPEQWQSLLVLKPDLGLPTRAKVFFPSEGVLDPDGGFEEVELDPIAPRPRPPEEFSPSLDKSAAIPPKIPPKIPPVEDELEDTLPPRRSHTSRAWVLFSSIAAGLLALSFWWPGGSRLGLEIEERNGQLHIRWDRNSRGLHEARKGRLEIREGASRVRSEFDGADLRESSVYYVPRSRQVDVLLKVETGQGAIEEQAQFTGPAAAP